MKIKDVQPELIRLVHDMARERWPNGYNLSADMQDSYEAMQVEYIKTGRITIWTGASESSIFGIPAANWCFRAWHDWWHIQLYCGFNYKDELKVLRYQQSDAMRWCVQNGISFKKTRLILLLLEAEIKGQADYELEHGEFPADQIKFAEEYVQRTERITEKQCGKMY